MMDARPFHFKHFSLFHHRSTMKVGTDAVLLGRWVEVSPTDAVLDIGTGCGIMPLMLAQKGAGKIDAVELDAASANEAEINFLASQWRDKLRVYQSDVRDFATNEKYDLIISNPPFFINSYKSDTERKNLARHTDDSLSFAELCASASRLLKDDGRFAVVFPVAESVEFLKEAEKNGFYQSKRMEIVPVEEKEPNRVNLELKKMPSETILTTSFVIRGADGRFTAEYDEFLRDFYLG
ncbi:MAG: methyltransferase [Bacteroidales bacterium]|nr:methyltransferase [Bacteroidales bacterium]